MNSLRNSTDCCMKIECVSRASTQPNTWKHHWPPSFKTLPTPQLTQSWRLQRWLGTLPSTHRLTFYLKPSLHRKSILPPTTIPHKPLLYVNVLTAAVFQRVKTHLRYISSCDHHVVHCIVITVLQKPLQLLRFDRPLHISMTKTICSPYLILIQLLI